MAKNWLDILGWTTHHVDELRFTGFDFLREAKYERAKIYFEALVILDPSSAYDKQTLGAIYLELDEHQKAFDVLQDSLRLDPTNSAAKLNQAKALIGLNQLPQALEMIRMLKKDADPSIASDAQALLLAYSS